MTATMTQRKPRPISKEKVKEVISILDVAEKYSDKINKRPRQPQILCPFHEDRNLGSCRIYTDTNTFKCESCGAHGDTFTLASGYLGMKSSGLNELLETLICEFGIQRESVQVDYTPGKKVIRKPPERMSSEEYTRLLHSDHYSIPCRFEEIEYEEGEFDYVPVEYNHIYYRSLALKDPEFHDWVLCTVSRKFWLRYADMLFTCQRIGFTLMEEIIQGEMEAGKALLLKGLLNKSLYRPELKLRNELLNDMLTEKRLSA